MKSQQLFIQNKFKMVNGCVSKIGMEDLCVICKKEIYLNAVNSKIIDFELLENLSKTMSYITIYFEGEMNKNCIVLKCSYSDFEKIGNIKNSLTYFEKPQLIKLTKNQYAKLRDKLFIKLKKQQF